MAEKTTPGANPSLEHHAAPVMTKESSSSGFMKVIAFFDLLVKMAAAGALIGILVLLVQINGHIKDIASGEEVPSLDQVGGQLKDARYEYWESVQTAAAVGVEENATGAPMRIQRQSRRRFPSSRGAPVIVDPPRRTAQNPTA
ncbi:hypothetical protein NM208_g2558 [Fusarium decemcellulare]|uniref:Uncharacterized protein n=1 Tax=Fusarium decemcellulare TaxID=57161 RepID=A0ACC1SS11_9HYPO|nr:hypothetical protein NM208_g2558 [Fusarium decemcellulare]